MARHRSEAPPAPRHAWNEPDDVGDPFGDPFGPPSTGVALASPPTGFRAPSFVPDPFGDPDPFADRFPFGTGAAGVPSGLPVAPRPETDARALGADRPAGAVPAPWSGPMPSVAPSVAPSLVPPPRDPAGTAAAPAHELRRPEVPAPRPGATGGRHSWITPPPPAAPAPDIASGPPSEPIVRDERPRGGQGGRRAKRGSAGHDPETTPLDLAAIALASARTATGSHRLPPTTGSTATVTGRSGPLALPGAPTTGGHRLLAGGRGLQTTRAAGALAVAGALVSAGVAVLSSGSMLASADAPGSPAVVQHHEAAAPSGGANGAGGY